MGSTGRFIIVSIVAVIVLGGGSLLWVRFTARPRPKLLQDVRDTVIHTAVGRQAADALGVSDEETVTPIDIGQTVTSGVSGVKQAVQDRIQTIIVQNAVRQLEERLEHLSPQQQKYVQEIICTPAQ